MLTSNWRGRVVIVLVTVCGISLVNHAAMALQKHHAAAGSCLCTGGHGSCSSRSGDGLVSCYKAKDDTCTGSSNFDSASGVLEEWPNSPLWDLQHVQAPACADRWAATSTDWPFGTP